MSATARERHVLRVYGYTDDQIGAMPRAQLDAELEDAADAGIGVMPRAMRSATVTKPERLLLAGKWIVGLVFVALVVAYMLSRM